MWRKEKAQCEWNQENQGEHNLLSGGQAPQVLKAEVNEFCLYPKHSGIVYNLIYIWNMQNKQIHRDRR